MATGASRDERFLSLLQAGSEAYSAARTYYLSVKAAAKLNVIGAATIVDDLSRSFPARGNGRSPATGKDGVQPNGNAEPPNQ